MVVLLMQYGADPSLRDAEGCSCIHLACQFGHTAIAGYLIAQGQVGHNWNISNNMILKKCHVAEHDKQLNLHM